MTQAKSLRRAAELALDYMDRITSPEGCSLSYDELLRRREALRDALRCRTEDDCEHMPWCRIRGRCISAGVPQ